jgi:hypothetical protein
LAFDNFFSTLSQTAVDSDYRGIFATSASTVSLSANLSSLSAEGSDIVKFVRYRMGEPKVVCELDNLQIFAAFEESTIEYGSMINKSFAMNWLSNLYGLNRDFSTQNLTDKLPHQTLDYLNRLATPYGSEANQGGLQNQRKAYAEFSTTDQDKNLLTGFVDYESGSSVADYITTLSAGNISVRTVYHQEPASVYRYYDPYSSANVLSQEFQYESFSTEGMFYMMPVYGDLLRAGMLETSDYVRKSGYSYGIVGDKFRIYPQPLKGVKVFIDYTVEMDPFNPDFKNPNIGDPSITGISSIHNIPTTDINFENVNSTGKRWIRQYTLAICMETLGRIRRKFSSIPIPNNEITLDGDTLVQEGLEKQQELKDELNSTLDKVNNVEMMRGDAELAQAISDQYAHIPFTAPFAMMG